MPTDSSEERGGIKRDEHGLVSGFHDRDQPAGTLTFDRGTVASRSLNNWVLLLMLRTVSLYLVSAHFLSSVCRVLGELMSKTVLCAGLRGGYIRRKGSPLD